MHQDGLLLSLFSSVLDDVGIIERLASAPASGLTVGDLASVAGCSRAYLHVMLRCLAQAGWLTRTGHAGADELVYAFSQRGREHLPHLASYRAVARFLRTHLPLEKTALGPAGDTLVFSELERLVDLAVSGWVSPGAPVVGGVGDVIDAVRINLDGTLVIPMLLALWQAERLDDPWKGHERHHGTRQAMRLFAHLGWVDEKRRTWTREGAAVRKHVLHYGTVGSYIPMLLKLPELLAGIADNATHEHEGQEEAHVDRRLNVLASAHGHKRYFQDADAIFIELFDKKPLDEQPAFVADMGCGDGSWLRHIYELVRDRTERGKHLDAYPLSMVGIDYNAAALRITQSTLEAAGVPCLVVAGDITDPDGVAADLRERGLEMERGLHIRSFIDHNRVYDARRAEADHDLDFRARSTGAYVDERGELVSNTMLRRDLVSFLQRWTPHVRRHGLVILEAHCVDPSLTAMHVGETHNIVFDAYHGLSRQYPVDFNVFMEAAELAGLRPVLHDQKRYPARLPFVSMSINRFVVADAMAPLEALADAAPAVPADRTSYVRELVARASTASPAEATDAAPFGPTSPADRDAADAAMRAFYEYGDPTRLKPWCAPAMAALLRGTLGQIDGVLDQIRQERRMPVLSVLDYGDHTGAFASELLVAMREGGQLGRLQQLGVRFEIVVVDAPSAAFASAQARLAAYRHVRCVALRSKDGKRERLAHRIGGDRIDVAVVPNLIRAIAPRVLAALLDDLAEVICEGGSLLWSSPMVAASGEGATLAELLLELRRRALGILAQRGAALDPETARRAEAYTRRRMPLDGPTAGVLDALFEKRFEEMTSSQSFEVRSSELVDLFVAADLLPEVEGRHAVRRLAEQAAREPFPGPAMSDGPALQWAFGEHRVKR